MTLLANEDAACLAAIAGAAARDLSIGAALPPGWSVFETVPIDAPPLGPGTIGGQALFATGALPSDPATQVTVLALSLPFISYAAASSYQPNQRNTGLAAVPTTIVNAGGQALAPAIDAYSALRGTLWEVFARTAPRPLWITGAHVGGAMAAIAALDFRPGQTGPDGKTHGPADPATLVMLSTPDPGDATFAAILKTEAGPAYSLLTSHLGRPIDDFPGPPATGTIGPAVPAGTPVRLAARTRTAALGLIAEGDTWIERDADSYVLALGQRPVSLGTVAANLAPGSKPVDVLSAATLADLLGLPYLLAQRPGLSLPAPLAPYALQSQILDGDTLWGVVLTAPGKTAILLRGSIGWVEFAGITCNYLPAPVPFEGSEWASGNVHGGALALYTALQPAIGSAVRAALKANPSEELIFAGHGVGGPAALLSGLTAVLEDSPATAPQIWTFGAPQYATIDFVQAAEPLIGATTRASVRRADFLPRIPLAQQSFHVGTAVTLVGRPAVDDPTEHGLSSYAQLLSPRETAPVEVA